MHRPSAVATITAATTDATTTSAATTDAPSAPLTAAGTAASTWPRHRARFLLHHLLRQPRLCVSRRRAIRRRVSGASGKRRLNYSYSVRAHMATEAVGHSQAEFKVAVAAAAGECDVTVDALAAGSTAVTATVRFSQVCRMQCRASPVAV